VAGILELAAAFVNKGLQAALKTSKGLTSVLETLITNIRESAPLYRRIQAEEGRVLAQPVFVLGSVVVLSILSYALFGLLGLIGSTIAAVVVIYLTWLINKDKNKVGISDLNKVRSFIRNALVAALLIVIGIMPIKHIISSFDINTGYSKRPVAELQGEVHNYLKLLQDENPTTRRSAEDTLMGLLRDNGYEKIANPIDAYRNSTESIAIEHKTTEPDNKSGSYCRPALEAIIETAIRMKVDPRLAVAIMLAEQPMVIDGDTCDSALGYARSFGEEPIDAIGAEELWTRHSDEVKAALTSTEPNSRAVIIIANMDIQPTQEQFMVPRIDGFYLDSGKLVSANDIPENSRIYVIPSLDNKMSVKGILGLLYLRLMVQDNAIGDSEQGLSLAYTIQRYNGLGVYGHAENVPGLNGTDTSVDPIYGKRVIDYLENAIDGNGVINEIIDYYSQKYNMPVVDIRNLNPDKQVYSFNQSTQPQAETPGTAAVPLAAVLTFGLAAGFVSSGSQKRRLSKKAIKEQIARILESKETEFRKTFRARGYSEEDVNSPMGRLAMLLQKEIAEKEKSYDGKVVPVTVVDVKGARLVLTVRVPTAAEIRDNKKVIAGFESFVEIDGEMVSSYSTISPEHEPTAIAREALDEFITAVLGVKGFVGLSHTNKKVANMLFVKGPFVNMPAYIREKIRQNLLRQEGLNSKEIAKLLTNANGLFEGYVLIETQRALMAISEWLYTYIGEDLGGFLLQSRYVGLKNKERKNYSAALEDMLRSKRGSEALEKPGSILKWIIGRLKAQVQKGQQGQALAEFALVLAAIAALSVSIITALRLFGLGDFAAPMTFAGLPVWAVALVVVVGISLYVAYRNRIRKASLEFLQAKEMLDGAIVRIISKWEEPQLKDLPEEIRQLILERQQEFVLPNPGSGVVFFENDTHYYILTAGHVVNPHKIPQKDFVPGSYHIVLPDGSQYPAEVVAVSYEWVPDIAVIKVSKIGITQDIHPIQLGTTGLLQEALGRKIFVLGRPIEAQEIVVSKLLPNTEEEELVFEPSTSFGASGGALIYKGRIIGIVSGVKIERFYEGVAVSINTIIDFLRNISTDDREEFSRFTDGPGRATLGQISESALVPYEITQALQPTKDRLPTQQSNMAKERREVLKFLRSLGLDVHCDPDSHPLEPEWAIGDSDGHTNYYFRDTDDAAEILRRTLRYAPLSLEGRQKVIDWLEARDTASLECRQPVISQLKASDTDRQVESPMLPVPAPASSALANQVVRRDLLKAFLLGQLQDGTMNVRRGSDGIRVSEIAELLKNGRATFDELMDLLGIPLSSFTELRPGDLVVTYHGENTRPSVTPGIVKEVHRKGMVEVLEVKLSQRPEDANASYLFYHPEHAFRIATAKEVQESCRNSAEPSRIQSLWGQARRVLHGSKSNNQLLPGPEGAEGEKLNSSGLGTFAATMALTGSSGLETAIMVGITIAVLALANRERIISIAKDILGRLRNRQEDNRSVSTERAHSIRAPPTFLGKIALAFGALVTAITLIISACGGESKTPYAGSTSIQTPIVNVMPAEGIAYFDHATEADKYHSFAREYAKPINLENVGQITVHIKDATPGRWVQLQLLDEKTVQQLADREISSTTKGLAYVPEALTGGEQVIRANIDQFLTGVNLKEIKQIVLHYGQEIAGVPLNPDNSGTLEVESIEFNSPEAQNISMSEPETEPTASADQPSQTKTAERLLPLALAVMLGLAQVGGDKDNLYRGNLSVRRDILKRLTELVNQGIITDVEPEIIIAAIDNLRNLGGVDLAAQRFVTALANHRIRIDILPKAIGYMVGNLQGDDNLQLAAQQTVLAFAKQRIAPDKLGVTVHYTVANLDHRYIPLRETASETLHEFVSQRIGVQALEKEVPTLLRYLAHWHTDVRRAAANILAEFVKQGIGTFELIPRSGEQGQQTQNGGNHGAVLRSFASAALMLTMFLFGAPLWVVIVMGVVTLVGIFASPLSSLKIVLNQYLSCYAGCYQAQCATCLC
jgi:hypothetical protein